MTDLRLPVPIKGHGVNSMVLPSPVALVFPRCNVRGTVDRTLSSAARSMNCGEHVTVCHDIAPDTVDHFGGRR